MNVDQRIVELESLLLHLQKKTFQKDKIAILNTIPLVQDYFKNNGNELVENFLSHYEYIIKAIIAIGQSSLIFNFNKLDNESKSKLQSLLDKFVEVDHFYNYMGGVIGYYLTLLKLIVSQQVSPSINTTSRFIHPEGLSLVDDDEAVREAVRGGIETLNQIGEIYPIGGAGDRLNIVDEKSGESLPAAVLPFLGFTLLENLIRDLQAREYLYYKIFNKQICTPIAMMTSLEKNNNQHIIEISKAHNWFGRSPESFIFFEQPLIPVVTEGGDFSLSTFLTLVLKPSGHGVLWKLAEEKGIFSWFKTQGRFNCVVRQINNPLAGLDFGLLALSGIGCRKKKSMGFLSCERLLKSAEGTNVLIETQTEKGFEYKLTNIEYTDFIKKGVNDEPRNLESPYSRYPTNTNILFVHIPAIEKALLECPIPGLLVNMKTKVSFLDAEGQLSTVAGGRLESTMQNIADYITDFSTAPLAKDELKTALQTFILYNERIKTISTAKVRYKEGESPLGTPEQAHYDLMTNNLNLFKEKCHFQTPSLGTIDHYIKCGPEVLISYHPALGPLYSVIAQKIQGGMLANHSELNLEIAEVDIRNLSVTGSLIITSDTPLGHLDDRLLLKYGKESRCQLHNIVVDNLGIDRKANNSYWKNEIQRKECCKIILGEGSEFQAENMTLLGNRCYKVPHHHRMVLGEDGSEYLTPITTPTWRWKYFFDMDNRVCLEKELAITGESITNY